MTGGLTDAHALALLQRRIETMLPPAYQDGYEERLPAPMKSAGLVYGDDGRVAWDRIWESFCDLAMAGGPPHKGALLEPGTPAEIAGEPVRYDEVVEEIGRGVWLAAALEARPSPTPGWVRVHCFGEAMAGWLLRAITMENVAVRVERAAIDLPASPRFRLEKEVKNVVTVIAKTCHYWMGHLPRPQQQAIGDLLGRLAAETPLVGPRDHGAAEDGAADRLAAAVTEASGLRRAGRPYGGWLGLACPSVGAAIWTMRGLVVSNVLARREETTLFVPVNPVVDPEGRLVADALARAHRLAVHAGRW
jgi:sirohydrochlorin cobaltochelatase